MPSLVCVDASLVVALLTHERFSQAALALWEHWIEGDIQPVAPMLLRYEVTSALYRKAMRQIMEEEDARQALHIFLSLQIEYRDPSALPERAFTLAGRFQRPNTYDAFYLALAEEMNQPFWTADERLYNAIRSAFPLIRWLGAP